MSATGLVIQTFNRFFKVQVGHETYTLQPKGVLKKAKDPNYSLPVIGDQVQFELNPNKTGVDGYVTAIEMRKNCLLRAAEHREKTKVMAANLEWVFVVSAVTRPDCDFGLTDRFISSCHLQNLQPVLIFNKIDLDLSFLERPELQVYKDLGYAVIETSVKKGLGIDRIRAMVNEGIALFAGPSGVGKSSLINHLLPKSSLRVGEVAQKGGFGKHTTTSSQLLPFAKAYLADSPGLRDYSPPAVEPEQVRFGFVEIAETQSECKFATCTHISEPNCMVKDAVRLGEIASWRYKNYRDLYFEMKEKQENKY